jgi:Leucine-rich repeat (LRR) protein
VLNLFNNRITSIPKSIDNLVNIDYLQLSENEITELPESIGNIQLVTAIVGDFSECGCSVHLQ